MSCTLVRFYLSGRREPLPDLELTGSTSILDAVAVQKVLSAEGEDGGESQETTQNCLWRSGHG